MLNTCPTMKSHLFFAKNLASKPVVSIWKSGGVVLKFGLNSDEHVMMTAVQLCFQSHPQVWSLVTSITGWSGCTHLPLVGHAKNMPITCLHATHLDMPLGEKSLTRRGTGLIGAWMRDYKITAMSLKAKQGLWRLMGASCSLLQRKKIRQRKGSLRMTPALYRPVQSH